MSKSLYVSRHWSVREWDCLKRSRNEYAWDNEHGRLCTNDENTANLFKVMDTLRDWNKGWVVNTTRAGYKSGYLFGRIYGSYRNHDTSTEVQIREIGTNLRGAR